MCSYPSVTVMQSTRGLWGPLVMLDPAWNEVPQEGSDFNLLRERLCASLSINTCGLDWTHLKSLAVNEREREVTRLYRAIIMCLRGTRTQRRHTGNPLLAQPGTEPKPAPLGRSRWSIDRLIIWRMDSVRKNRQMAHCQCPLHVLSVYDCRISTKLFIFQLPQLYISTLIQRL